MNRAPDILERFTSPDAFAARPIPGAGSEFGLPPAVDWRDGPRRVYQVPVLAMEVQGSAGARAAPFCKSSMETPSGERTKAMRPSRGGRLMVTPPSRSLWQAA